MRYLIYSLIFISLSACQPTPEKSAGVDIDKATFTQMMDQAETVVLDVRTPGEIVQGKINGAIEIDFKGPDFEQKIAELDKNKTYLVYCRSGGRSSNTCDLMEKKGFKKVHNLLGGYSKWSN